MRSLCSAVRRLKHTLQARRILDHCQHQVKTQASVILKRGAQVSFPADQIALLTKQLQQTPAYRQVCLSPKRVLSQSPHQSNHLCLQTNTMLQLRLSPTNHPRLTCSPSISIKSTTLYLPSTFSLQNSVGRKQASAGRTVLIRKAGMTFQWGLTAGRLPSAQILFIVA